MVQIPQPWNTDAPLDDPSWLANKKFCVEDLARSGLTIGDIPVFAEPNPTIETQFGRGQPVLLSRTSSYCYYTIPYYYGDGQAVMDVKGRPKMYRKRTTDKVNRYLSPSRDLAESLVTMPYFCPIRQTEGNKNGLYVIVEGEKKYAKLLKEEHLYGCAIGGKDMWREDGNLHPLLVQDIIDAMPEEILIVPDGDWHRQDIFASYSMLIFQLRERFREVHIRVADLSSHRSVTGERMGIDDYLHSGGKWSDVVIVDIEHELLLSPDVLIGRFGLASRETRRGHTIIENASNADKILHMHPLFGSELLRFDIDKDHAIFQNETDSVMDRLQVTLQRYCRMPTISHGAVRSAANIVLHEREYSPFKDWLHEIKWDGIERIIRLFLDCVKTDEEPEAYRSVAALRVMLQTVSRVLSPGGKADTVVVLVGRQGIRKTMFWEMLSYDSYADLPKDIKDKDAMMVLAKKRFVIIEEMAYYRGRAAEEFKAMITRRQDTYRPPYGSEVLTRDRRCVFVGNHNSREFMRENENRRLMPIWVSDIDLGWLENNREQLYAEAVARYERGEQWWDEDESKWEEAKGEFMEEVPHIERIEAAITHVLKGDAAVRYEGELCFRLRNVAAMLEDLRMRPQDIGGYIRRLGWTDVRPRIKGFQGRLWIKDKTK